MKNNFVMFCKTYRKDFEQFKILINSFNKYNVENLLMIVSCPWEDLEIFKPFSSKNCAIIADESYAKDYLTTSDKEYNGLSKGYVNQEICKLSFWESGIAQNYLCIDSDAQFIRTFSTKDFMFNENIPYTVLVEDKDLSIEKHYQAYWNERQNFIKKIFNEIELNDIRYRTCHNMQVFNSQVLKSFKEDFMKPKGYSYKDLIKISPFEFTWYNAWFQKCKLIPEYASEPFFKMFHMRIEYTISRLKGLTTDDYAKRYVGICLNSNWNKQEKEYIPQTWFLKKLFKILKKL